MPIRLSSLFMLLCALICVSESQQESGSSQILPDCSGELGSKALIKHFRRLIFEQVIGAIEGNMEYSCFLEEGALVRITSPEVFGNLAIKMNISITEHEEVANQISISGFVEGAIEEWRSTLSKMGNVREFGCNYKRVPFNHPDGYSIFKHKVVCLFAKD